MLLGLIFWFTGSLAGQPEKTAPRDLLDASISRAAEALTALLKADGSFVYEARLDGRPVKPQYNLVRHAGAIYALNMFEARWLSPAAKWDIESALDFLKLNVRPLSESGPPMSAVLASWRGDGDTVLGATALGVVAFLTAETRKQSGDEKALIRNMGAFLLSMQQPDGAFYSRYNFQHALRDDSFNSLYYPGEAALALVHLFSWDTSSEQARWGDAARRALLYLAETRALDQEYPPDNWALTATRAFFEAGVPISEDERAKLILHAERVVEADLLLKVEQGSDPVLSGALTDTGSTTQTSTRLEGLLAALTFIKSQSVIARTKQAIRPAMAFLLQSQIQEGPLEGAFPETVIVDPQKHRHLFVRIDYIQHALSAMILYRDSNLLAE
ncbi:hypothetical protein [Bradyrhizobium lablabi]|uniref:hypothetical protein n=1 Tax=Bradyrhizobium lablabi TaxID=722472 RepID=UPI0009A7B2C9|nr:hypothetical protein [Bradyrhizobium lablabi]